MHIFGACLNTLKIKVIESSLVGVAEVTYIHRCTVVTYLLKIWPLSILKNVRFFSKPKIFQVLHHSKNLNFSLFCTGLALK